MTHDSHHLTGGQKTYLFLLRAIGWVGLLFVPFFAFGWATGNLRFADYLPLVAMVSAPGILVSLFLTGTPDRPAWLLRPTSFLKAFFICGLTLGFVSMAIMFEIFAIVAVIDTSTLFPALGLPDLEHMFYQMLIKQYGAGGVEAMRASLGFNFAAAMLVAYPCIMLVNLTSLVSWFVRFPKTAVPPRAIVDRNQPAAYNEEKARALRAMRKRLHERSTA